MQLDFTKTSRDQNAICRRYASRRQTTEPFWTSFEVQHGRINYRLKNTNTRSKEVWRYHSFDSCATFGQKKSTMIAALKKVDYFASDNSGRMVSAIHKLREFKNLDYPNDMRREVCEILMQESGNIVWRIVGALQAQI